MQRRTVFVLAGIALVICMCAGLSASGLGVAAFVLAPAGEAPAIASAPLAPGSPASATALPRQPGKPAPSPTPAPWRPDPVYTAYAESLRSLSVPDLAAEIVNADTLWKSVAATEEALARGGVGISDFETVYVQPYSPSAGFVAIPPETLQLALEARQPAADGRLTAAQYAQLLDDFGWPFQADSTPGQQMVALLRDVVNEARQDPENEESYLGLFLDESAKLKQPPVDLSVQGLDPEQVPLNLLEMQLFAAEFNRAVEIAAAPETMSPPLRFASFEPPVGEREAFAYALQTNPCSRLRDEWLGQAGREAHGVAVREARRQFLKNAFPAGTTKTIATTISALNMALRIQKLVAIYSNSQVAVIASNHTIHKPNETTPPKYVLFTARAGVNDQDWDAYQKQLADRGLQGFPAVQDCLKTVGLPNYTNLAALANDAENWQVQWEVRPQDSPHVEIKLGGTHPADDENVFDLPGLLQNKLVRTSPTTAETELRLNIKEERKAAHDSGIETAAKVKVCALAKTSGRPPLSTFVTGARSWVGMAESLVDLGAGWIQTMLPPSSCATLEVTYHDPISYVVEMDSRIHTLVTAQGVGPLFSTDSHVQATIKLVYDHNLKTWTGSGPMNYVSWSVQDLGGSAPCKNSAGPAADPAPFEVTAMTIPSEPAGPGDPGIAMTYQTNDMRETMIYSCPNLAPISGKGQTWRGRFDARHDGEGGYSVLNWTLTASPDHPIYAQKKYSRTGFKEPAGAGTVIVDEETVFELKKTSK